MRKSYGDQGVLEFTPIDEKKVAELKKMDEVIKSSKKILFSVENDLLGDADPNLGRSGMSADRVLRLALVKQMYGWSYEELYTRVMDSIALRRFCDYEFEYVPKPSTLHENIKKLKPETFEAVNQEFLKYAKCHGLEDGQRVRIDSTGVESNIHHPRDSVLIEDGVRLVTRALCKCQTVFPRAGIVFHDRRRVVKRRAFAIANAKNKAERDKLYKELHGFGKEVLGYGREGVSCLFSLQGTDDEKDAARIVARELRETVRLLAKVLDQTERRVLKGQKVPAEEKVFSLFEPHTDIIEKGSREPVFGHKVFLSMGKKLVLDCVIEEGNPADTELFTEMLDRQKKLYRRYPKDIATDAGFASADNALYAKKKGVENVSFAKRVGKVLNELIPTGAVQRLLQRFRAGAEGIISALKRGVGLTRCLWRGWESFQAYVWSAICAHNLKMITAAALAKK